MHTALVLAGREATGKSSALRTVISALGSKEGDTEMKTVRLQKIYPGVFNEQCHVFGCVEEERGSSWRDGIFTAIVKKSMKVCVHVHVVTMYVCYVIK